MRPTLPVWHAYAGTVAVVAVVGLALLASHIPLASWAHPAGWVLVLGGTFAATLLSHGWADWQSTYQRLTQTPNVPFLARVEATRQTAYALAKQARQQGLLTLQHKLNVLAAHPDTALLAQGLELALDNIPAATVQERMSTQLEATYHTELEAAKLLEAAAGYAPTMGLLGALLGLMSALGQPLSQLTAATTGVAQAFSATLLGVALANLVLQPLAHKLRRQAKHNWQLATLQLQTVLSLQAGEHPTLLLEKWAAYQPTNTSVARPASVPSAPRWEEPPTSSVASVGLPLASSLGRSTPRPQPASAGLKRGGIPSAGGASKPSSPRPAQRVSPGRAAMLGASGSDYVL